ncbi:PREDICTED: uncharacterized protein LOC109220227 [Nicotiana attenuata]|uniref:uncharacterized protein LOC109220227 n=1 Tax=Nicotiana attenuata TaxID=49451 RepID=UPI0009052F3F|nr:PREDICTED: uncharacterized protein LOC109220227 [Nicotiana attenuata]
MVGDDEISVTDKTTLDSTSPLYMHPLERAGSMLVLVAFDRTGYRSWRRGILRALSVKNKELEDRYDRTNGAKLYQLHKEINDLSQGNLDITGYYTKMKKLWEELNTLNIHAKCDCKCTCGAKENMHKAEQERRLIQFLMGLNEVYTVIRGSILMMNSLPTIAQAFSILIQEEKQREVKPSNHFSMEPASLNATGPGNNNFRTNYTQQGNNNTNSRYRGNQFNNRPRLFCDYCKRPGHTKEKSYKLHGFPQNSKFNKGRRITGNVFGSSSEGAAMKDDGNDSQGQEHGRTMHNLTKEQYGQLLNILKSFQGGGDKSTNTTINGGTLQGPSLKRPLEIGKAKTGLQHLMEAVLHECEPSSYEEAAVKPAWQAGMNQEFQALYANKTWDLVPPPIGKKTIGV